MIISFALTACMVFTTEFGSLAADTQSDAQPIETINHETTISPLAETWNEIPETAAVAEATQVWHGKALANVESEADVLAEAVDGGEVVGKMYTNTILTVEERGDVWSKVSSGSVVGYVKNEMLAFGSDAVARAAAIDMTNPQDAKTLEEIAAEEAAKKAAEEEAARKAAEEAARQSGSSVRYDEAMSASADDQTLLAAIIYCEAGNQPHDGKVGVGAVILNRVKDSRFPNSISGVIYQPGAFTAVSDGQINAAISEDSTVYKAAQDAMNGWDPTGGCVYYFNPSTATNKWIWSRPLIKTIGKHRFCK